MSALRHRAEIDGLRALAVLPVVLYHAGLGFPGGYVGVDVFFVISGYLISSLILKQGSSFSLVQFWERRVRRLVPALTVMLAVTSLAAWLLLFPDDFRRFGASLSAQSLLLSNVFFWRDSGYFEVDAVRPLLHTWSLAVEEQFYLLFPLVLVQLGRLTPKRVFWWLAGATLVSFAASSYGVYRHPHSTFYLLPTRAWELLLGALLAAQPVERSRSQWLDEALSAGGVAAILLASLTYDADVRFPGPAALLPCLGTVAVIAGTGTRPTLGGRLLSFRPLVFVGLISYSLYLWHWPLFTFAGYWLAPLNRWDYVGLTVVSLVLAAASWRVVETPVRERKLLPERGALLAAAAVSCVALLLTGSMIAKSDGAPQRFRPEALRYLEAKADQGLRPESSLADIRAGRLVELGIGAAAGKVELLVWGDSHAMTTLSVLKLACEKRHVRCLAATHSATAPFVTMPGQGRYSLREDADEYGRLLIDLVARQQVRKVLLAAAWPGYYELGPEPFRNAFAQTVTELTGAGADVYVLEDVPFPGYDVPTALAVAASHGSGTALPGVPRAEHEAKSQAANAVFHAFGDPRLHVLDPLPFFGVAGDRYRVEKDGLALYFDRHHLSTRGALQLRPLLERVLDDVGHAETRQLHSTRNLSPTRYRHRSTSVAALE